MRLPPLDPAAKAYSSSHFKAASMAKLLIPPCTTMVRPGFPMQRSYSLGRVPKHNTHGVRSFPPQRWVAEVCRHFAHSIRSSALRVLMTSRIVFAPRLERLFTQDCMRLGTPFGSLNQTPGGWYQHSNCIRLAGPTDHALEASYQKHRRWHGTRR